jgi:hypothetical protein
VNKAKAAGAQAVIHCGDLIGANTLRASIKLGVPLHVVHGNNLGPERLQKIAERKKIINASLALHGAKDGLFSEFTLR